MESKKLSILEASFLDTLIRTDIKIAKLYDKFIMLNMYNDSDRKKQEDIIKQIKELHDVEKHMYSMFNISIDNLDVYRKCLIHKLKNNEAMVKNLYINDSKIVIYRIFKELEKNAIVNTIKKGNKDYVNRKKCRSKLLNWFKNIEFSKIYIRELSFRIDKISYLERKNSILNMYRKIFSEYYLEEDLLNSDFNFNIFENINMDMIVEVFNVNLEDYLFFGYIDFLARSVKSDDVIEIDDSNTLLAYLVASSILFDVDPRKRIFQSYILKEIRNRDEIIRFIKDFGELYKEDVVKYKRISLRPNKK